MSKIVIKNAVKKYGDTVVIEGLNAEIPEGSLFTLLGPSGCGKTTLLRMIAGFNSIEGGEFFFDNTLINNLDPSKRNIGMVFQNYAIFPHLSVEDNIKFGLKQRKLPKDEIQKRTDHFLKLMQIEQYRSRMPAQLSGGQQQRVGIARALAANPNIVLMDEPFGSLDSITRKQLHRELKALHQLSGTTLVFVTHDIAEALTLGTKVLVLDKGTIQQYDTPEMIKQHPANEFVKQLVN